MIYFFQFQSFFGPFERYHETVIQKSRIFSWHWLYCLRVQVLWLVQGWGREINHDKALIFCWNHDKALIFCWKEKKNQPRMVEFNIIIITYYKLPFTYKISTIIKCQISGIQLRKTHVIIRKGGGEKKNESIFRTIYMYIIK